MPAPVLRIVIVEDDPLHASSLKSLLSEMGRPVEILAVCTNVEQAFESIISHRPQLVFLDIALDYGESGFDLLKKFNDPEFAVIFTTGYNNSDNAILALRACALDFLPKPLVKNEMEEALHRFDTARGKLELKTLKQNLEEGSNNRFIIISGNEGKIKLDVTEVIYCLSYNVWTRFFLSSPVDKKLEHVSSMSIKKWEQVLDYASILRVHNRYLVNLKYCVKLSNNSSDGADFTLNNGMQIPVSKSRKKEVADRFKKYRSVHHR